MERHAFSALSAWLDRPDRKPLVIRGARQTGKSYLINDFSKRRRGDVVTVNLERDPGLAACFDPTDPHEIVDLLSLRLRRPINPAATVLFIDEIQAAPAVLSRLRWFAEELPQQAVIAAGSLLDFALADPALSMPVGRVSFGHLEPMSFAEFLLAAGEDRLLTAIRECLPGTPVHPTVHERALELVRTYALVGGMPAAVRHWVENRRLSESAEVHHDLLQAIRDDFAKYQAPGRGARGSERVAKVFAALPRLVGRKFMPSAVDREEPSLALREAYRLLALARVVTPVQRSSANGIPLGAEVDERYHKSCLLDVGLYVSLCGLDATSVEDAVGVAMVNEGQLAEQWVGQELRACRSFHHEPALFTWVREARNSNAEVDYLLQVGTRIVPIEVKAGASGRLRSLHMMVHERDLDLAVRVSTGPLQVSRVETALPHLPPRSFTLLSIPFYLVSELPRLISAVRAGEIPSAL